METIVDTTAVERLLSPLASSFDATALRSLVRYRADQQAQDRIDELAEKCNEGTLTPLEEREYDSLVQTATMVAILQAEAKKLLQSQSAWSMPADKELKSFVVQRANNQCEYCTIHQDDDQVFRFPVDRIISGQHGGAYTQKNTALACHNCNQKKGPNIASVSPDSPGSVVPLFNPRTNVWAEHFEFHGAAIVGLTPVGKSTIALLDMNAPNKLRLRSASGYSKIKPS